MLELINCLISSNMDLPETKCAYSNFLFIKNKCFFGIFLSYIVSYSKFYKKKIFPTYPWKFYKKKIFPTYPWVGIGKNSSLLRVTSIIQGQTPINIAWICNQKLFAIPEIGLKHSF